MVEYWFTVTGTIVTIPSILDDFLAQIELGGNHQRPFSSRASTVKSHVHKLQTTELP